MPVFLLVTSDIMITYKVSGWPGLLTVSVYSVGLTQITLYFSHRGDDKMTITMHITHRRENYPFIIIITPLANDDRFTVLMD